MTESYAGQLKGRLLKAKTIISYDLGELGDTKVLFEKSIGQHTVADCLVLSKVVGVVGIEFKSAHDTTRRLKRQLLDYLKVCQHVYVMCDKNILSHVLSITNDKMFENVGVIVTQDYEDEIVLGSLKKAQANPEFSLYMLADSLLWKGELYTLLKTIVTRPDLIDKNRKHISTGRTRAQGAIANNGMISSIRQDWTKRKMLTVYNNLVSDSVGTRAIVEMYLQNAMNPDKSVTMYRLGQDYESLR